MCSNHWKANNNLPQNQRATNFIFLLDEQAIHYNLIRVLIKEKNRPKQKQLEVSMYHCVCTKSNTNFTFFLSQTEFIEKSTNIFTPNRYIMKMQDTMMNIEILIWYNKYLYHFYTFCQILDSLIQYYARVVFS